MELVKAEKYYFDHAEMHMNDVPKQKTGEAAVKLAMECMILRDCIYSHFGIRFEYQVAWSNWFDCDGPGDGGCDQHIIDDEDERVILIQSKVNNVIKGKTWEMKYTMDAGELDRIEDFANGILAGTAKTQALKDVGGPGPRVTMLHDRIDDIHSAIKKGYEVTLVQLCTGTIAKHFETTQKPRIEAAGNFDIIAINCQDIGYHASEAMSLDETGGIPNPITLNFLMDDCSTTDAKVIHGFITASSLKKAVKAEKWKLTRQNLRHFKGKDATTANAGMVKTLDGDHENFHIYNNGLRITCDNMTSQGNVVENGVRVEKWELENAQIVNGGQTSFSIRNYAGSSPLHEVKVGTIIIKETDPDVLRNIAKRSNTQEALEAWDFHADSIEQIHMKDEFLRLQFDVDGKGTLRSFYYEQKGGAWLHLKNAGGASPFEIPRTTKGKKIHYKLGPDDVSWAHFVINCEPHISKGKKQSFHDSSKGGNYKEIFISGSLSVKWLLYTHILRNQCKTYFKERVNSGAHKMENQAVSHMVSLYLDYVYDIHAQKKKTFEDAVTHYFYQLNWWDGKQGCKIAEVNCEKFTQFLDVFVPNWSGTMQSNHKVELESPNSYFNGATAISDGTVIRETWYKTQEKTPDVSKTYSNMAEFYDSLFLAP